MGTRANIIIRIPAHTIKLPYTNKDGSAATRDVPHDEIILYRHWDGYPEETGTDLVWLLDALQRWDENTFRTTADIRATLFALSATKSLNYRLMQDEQWSTPYRYADYEDTGSIHGDIEFLYILTYLPNTEGNPHTTLDIEKTTPFTDERTVLRSIKLKKPLPNWMLFKDYTVPKEVRDSPYHYISDGEEIFSGVEVKA